MANLINLTNLANLPHLTDLANLANLTNLTTLAWGPGLSGMQDQGMQDHQACSSNTLSRGQGAGARARVKAFSLISSGNWP